MSALRPLYKALTARLRGDATLMALIPGGVHNGTAPTGTARPYLVMTTPIEEESNLLGAYGQAATIELETWTAPTVRTAAGVDEILDRVEALLRAPLNLDGHTAARARKEFRTVLVEEDESRHGLARYAVLTYESAV